MPSTSSTGGDPVLTAILERQDLASAASVFAAANIDLAALLKMKWDTLSELDIRKSPRKRIAEAIKATNRAAADDDRDTATRFEANLSGAISAAKEKKGLETGTPTSATDGNGEEFTRKEKLAKKSSMSNVISAAAVETAEAKPEAKTEAKPEATEAKPEPQAEAKPEATEAAKTETKTETEALKTDSATPVKPKATRTMSTASASVAIQLYPRASNGKLEPPDLCADSLSNVTHRGYLDKQGGLVKTYRKRYFVLQDRYLYYFSAPQSARCKGVIYLPSYRIMNAEKVTGRQFSFMAYHTTQRPYYFVASNLEDMQMWMKVLHRATTLDDPPTETPAPAAANEPATPQEFETFDVSLTKLPGTVIGLDISVSRAGGIVVTGVHKTGLAAEKNVREGDIISSVNGTNMGGLGSQAAVDIMKSLQGDVVLSFKRRIATTQSE